MRDATLSAISVEPVAVPGCLMAPSKWSSRSVRSRSPCNNKASSVNCLSPDLPALNAAAASNVSLAALRSLRPHGPVLVSSSGNRVGVWSPFDCRSPCWLLPCARRSKARRWSSAHCSRRLLSSSFRHSSSATRARSRSRASTHDEYSGQANHPTPTTRSRSRHPSPDGGVPPDA